MTDIYAEFGVNSAVMSSQNIEEHEQNMLSQDVSVRDGDDRITLAQDETEETNEQTDEAETVDGSEENQNGEVTEDPEGEQAQGDDFQPVADVPAQLTEVAGTLQANEDSFYEMVDSAQERGISPEVMTRIQEEYQNDGLTDSSYEALAKAGYSRSFVDSYIKGQEALVQQYMSGIVEYAGGQKAFNALYSHLQATDKGSADALVSAMENRQLTTVKAIINLAAASRGKTFGVKPARTVAQRGIPAAPVKAAQEGFASRSEMVKAMSDSRYRTDAAYRAEVERKVAFASF